MLWSDKGIDFIPEMIDWYVHNHPGWHGEYGVHGDMIVLENEYLRLVIQNGLQILWKEPSTQRSACQSINMPLTYEHPGLYIWEYSPLFFEIPT